MVFVVNQDSSTLDGFTVKTKENVKVEVNIPYSEVGEVLRLWMEFLPMETLKVQGRR